jgi:hypothetical protein
MFKAPKQTVDKITNKNRVNAKAKPRPPCLGNRLATTSLLEPTNKRERPAPYLGKDLRKNIKPHLGKTSCILVLAISTEPLPPAKLLLNRAVRQTNFFHRFVKLTTLRLHSTFFMAFYLPPWDSTYTAINSQIPLQ